MVLYLITGFLSGFLIPFMAGRFGKVVPADPGLLLLKLPHLPHFPQVNDPMRNYILRKKWKKLFFSAFLWALLCTKLFLLCYYVIPPSASIWGCVFCWIMCISMVIDAQYWLLPDFFTIPLLLIGLLFSYYAKTGIEMSLVGACSGYIISIFSVLLLSISSKTPQLGGGDVKMITAIGSWLGILGLSYTLILSFALFILLNFSGFQKKGAYGPALGMASIIVFFMMYVK